MAFLGVNIRDDRAAAIAFEQRNNVTWPSLYDPSSGLLLGLRDSLTAAAVPTSYVIDADGNIAVRLLDKQTAREPRLRGDRRAGRYAGRYGWARRSGFTTVV